MQLGSVTIQLQLSGQLRKLNEECEFHILVRFGSVDFGSKLGSVGVPTEASRTEPHRRTEATQLAHRRTEAASSTTSLCTASLCTDGLCTTLA